MAGDAAIPEWLLRGRELAGKRVLITGGCGYVGEMLARRILDLHPSVAGVRLVDVRDPGTIESMAVLLASRRVDYVRCDLSHDEVPCENIDVVFHFASHSKSGANLLAPPARIYAVNIGSTTRVIDACRRCGVQALVYLSTLSVCFGSEPLVDANEDVPYWPLERQTDAHARSKMIAEQQVLAAHSVALRTLALRPAVIYGEHERRNLPRAAALAAAGLFCLAVGPASARADWVHVDNLVDACVCAAGTLLRPPAQWTGKQAAVGAVDVGGRPFFVTDGTPRNAWIFFAPLVSALGMPTRAVRLPRLPVLALAHALELACAALRPIVALRPALTRAEVYKLSVHHTCSIRRAAADLGYVPEFGSDEGMCRVGAHYASSLYAALAQSRRQQAIALACVTVACCWLVAHIGTTALTVALTHTL